MTRRRVLATALFERAAAIDAALLAVPDRIKYLVLGCTVILMASVSIPNVPRQYFDYSRVPWLSGIQQYETYGTDSISDMYGAKVILNDPSDMFTKERLAQTPLEAATWSKEASAPYPPAVLLAEAGLYAFGEWSGIGFYGMILGLACVFLSLSAYYFLKTRWYLFPVLYLNFSYFSYRFVYVQDNTYIVMLVVIMAALFLARAKREACHALMAVAIVMKLSPLYYVKNVLTMRRQTALVFVAILMAGLVLPYFVWDNYLYIYRYGNDLKGDWASAAASLLFVVPFCDRPLVHGGAARLRHGGPHRVGPGAVRDAARPQDERGQTPADSPARPGQARHPQRRGRDRAGVPVLCFRRSSRLIQRC